MPSVDVFPEGAELKVKIKTCEGVKFSQTIWIMFVLFVWIPKSGKSCCVIAKFVFFDVGTLVESSSSQKMPVYCSNGSVSNVRRCAGSSGCG